MTILTALGNLCADAEQKVINDRQYLSFRIASNDRRNGQEETTYISVLASDSPNLLPFLKKGQQVFVQGRMSAKIFQSQQSFGIDISVFASSLQLCGSKKENSPSQSQSPVPSAAVSQQPQPQPQPTPDPSDPEEALPF